MKYFDAVWERYRLTLIELRDRKWQLEPLATPTGPEEVANARTGLLTPARTNPVLFDSREEAEQVAVRELRSLADYDGSTLVWTARAEPLNLDARGDSESR